MNRFDYTNLSAAMRKLARDSGRSKLEVCRMAAKGFIRDIVSITPPASKGVTGMAAKKAGEAAVERDIASIAIPVNGVPKGENLAEWHKQKWQNGRIRGGEQIAVARAEYNAFVRTMKKLVGFLSAGWNYAAEKLEVRGIPAWVKRHGSKFGEHKVTETKTHLSIELSNTVAFVGDVKAYNRRVQTAIDYQARKMRSQADALLKKRLRRAGFKT